MVYMAESIVYVGESIIVYVGESIMMCVGEYYGGCGSLL